MKRRDILKVGAALAGGSVGLGATAAVQRAPKAETTSTTERPLRIICFGAHPDDCELQVGGTAAKWAAKGHKVKFVSTTNGDTGHWRDAGGELARRRKAEVEAAAKILGITTEVLDIHNSELLPTLENRRTIVRLIREWEADIVMTHRPYDYHPDHRYTGILVQDAAFIVCVPNYCPLVPALKRNPVFLYYCDRFKKPYPSQADIVVAIDDVIDQKIAALEVMESQFHEGGAFGNESLWPEDLPKREARRSEIRDNFRARFARLADRYRAQIAEWYPSGQAEKIRYIEAFELCEYGREPDRAELKQLFPFYDT